MSDPARTPIAELKQSRLGFVVAILLDTFIVYILALEISSFIIPRWVAWLAPLLQMPAHIRPGDWYLQHLEWVTVVPALIAGYINVGRFVPAIIGKPIKENRSASAAVWAWSFPTMILIYSMLHYHAPSSVLFESSMSSFRYFFEIRTDGNTMRVLTQRAVTAPFYAGVAYSLGALAARHQVLVKLFSFERQEETSPSSGDDQT